MSFIHLKVSKGDRFSREMLLLFCDLVVLHDAASAVTGAVLVEIEENMVVGLNIF